MDAEGMLKRLRDLADTVDDVADGVSKHIGHGNWNEARRMCRLGISRLARVCSEMNEEVQADYAAHNKNVYRPGG